jgi:hypothetical protein
MRFSAAISACLLIATPTLALADATGTYNVVGRNADDGSTYKGTVKVSRTGATYKVVGVIDGAKSVGTGLGSHFENGGNTYVTGPASDKNRSRHRLCQQGFLRHLHLLPAGRRLLEGHLDLWRLATHHVGNLDPAIGQQRRYGSGREKGDRRRLLNAAIIRRGLLREARRDPVNRSRRRRSWDFSRAGSRSNCRRFPRMEQYANRTRVVIEFRCHGTSKSRRLV